MDNSSAGLRRGRWFVVLAVCVALFVLQQWNEGVGDSRLTTTILADSDVPTRTLHATILPDRSATSVAAEALSEPKRQQPRDHNRALGAGPTVVSKRSASSGETVAASGLDGAVVEEYGTDGSNPLDNGQFRDENRVEKPLPPLERPTEEVALNTTATRIFIDEATLGIPLTIGVLTAPALLRTRLIPLLESSLKREKDVHVFFMDDPKTLPGRAALREYLESVKRTEEVHIVALPPIPNMKMSLRNAWVNLPAVKYFREARPQQKWFAIMDDDTYFLMNAIRKILRDAELNTTLTGKPVYMGAPITDGLSGGCRVIRTGNTLRVQRTTTRKEVQFVCGGSGILFNRNTIEKLFVKNATGFDLIQQCMDTMFQGAGDVRLGHCLSEANVSIVARREMFRDTLFRAIGEKRVYHKHQFPASFHRFRRREWLYALRAVEDARERNELVTWGDLLKNFRPGAVYWHSMFYPMKYSNYSSIMGIKEKTAYQIRRETILMKKYHCGRKHNTDEW